MQVNNFNLIDLVYLIVKPDGSVFYILKNNNYSNHYLYINDIRKYDSYLMEKSFGLTFTRDNNIPKIMFFNELILDSCIIFENQSIYTSDKKYAFDFYLPSEITAIQKEIVDSHMAEIETAEFVFIEKYNSEIEDFQVLYNNLEELKSASLLKKYLEDHLVIKDIDGGVKK